MPHNEACECCRASDFIEWREVARECKDYTPKDLRELLMRVIEYFELDSQSGIPKDFKFLIQPNTQP